MKNGVKNIKTAAYDGARTVYNFDNFFHSYSAGSRRRIWISRRYEEAEKDIIPMLDSIRQGRYPNLAKVPAPNKYSVVKLVRYVVRTYSIKFPKLWYYGLVSNFLMYKSCSKFVFLYDSIYAMAIEKFLYLSSLG